MGFDFVRSRGDRTPLELFRDGVNHWQESEVIALKELAPTEIGLVLSTGVDCRCRAIDGAVMPDLGSGRARPKKNSKNHRK